jgi:hypothetical protein
MPQYLVPVVHVERIGNQDFSGTTLLAALGQRGP